MTIQITAEKNAALLCRLATKTFDQAFRKLNNPEDFDAYLSHAFSLDTISAEVSDNRVQFFVAFKEGEPVGYFKLYAGPAPECVAARPPVELARLYALKNQWGQGIGKAMMEKALALSRRQGYSTIWLSSWKKNHRGNTFYGKWGFETVGEQTFTLGADVQQDFILSRPL